MKKSYNIALAIILAVFAWVGIGIGFKHFFKKNDSQTTSIPSKKTHTFDVVLETSQAKKINNTLSLQGQVMPNRVIALRAQTSGSVAAILKTQGSRVKRGDVILRLQLDERHILQEQAQAAVRERQRNYEAAKNLVSHGYMSPSKIEEAAVALKQAQSEKAKIDEDVSRTSIRAPFAGVLDNQHVQIGDVVALGQDTFTLVENNPLIVTVNIPQDKISLVHSNAAVKVKIGDSTTQGTVRFLSPFADMLTHAFKCEIKIENPSNLPSGTSATAEITSNDTMAHFIPSSLLGVSKDGLLGIKTVNADGIVNFYRANIVQSTAEGVWLSGLPDTIILIKSGQDFVQPGEKINVKIPTTLPTNTPPSQLANTPTNTLGSHP